MAFHRTHQPTTHYTYSTQRQIEPRHEQWTTDLDDQMEPQPATRQFGIPTTTAAVTRSSHLSLQRIRCAMTTQLWDTSILRSKAQKQ